MARKPYIDKEELRAEIVKSQQSRQGTERLGEMTMTMCDHLLAMPQFWRYSQQDKEDMKSSALLRLWRNTIWKVNPDRNPFSYLTSAIYCQYLTCLSEMYKEANRFREFQEHEINRIIDGLDGDQRQDLEKQRKRLKEFTLSKGDMAEIDRKWTGSPKKKGGSK